MTKYIELLLKYRWLVLIGMAMVWILLVWSASGLHLEEDILALLPDNKEMEGYRTLLEDFNPMNSVLISIYSDNSDTDPKEHILSAADSLYQQLIATGQFTKIMYRWDLNDFQKTLKVLQNHRQMLFSIADSVELAQRLSYPEILNRLKEWKRTLAETPSPMVAGQLVQDPLGFNDILLNKLNQLQTVNANTEIYKGRIFDKAGNHLLMIAYPEISSMKSSQSQELVNDLAKLFKKFETRYNLKIAWIAAHRFSVENARRIKGDLQLTISVALLAIVVLSLLVYSRPVLMLFTLLPALFGSAFSLGIMHWIDPEISAIIIGTGAMLIGIAVDYGIHFLYQADQMTVSLNAENISGIVNRIHIPLLMSAGTTILAFMALQFSGMPAYTQLGWFVSLGILGAVVFVLIIFPVILSWMKQNSKRGAILNPGVFIQSMVEKIARKKRLVIGILIIICLIIIPGLINLQFEGDVQKLNSVSPEIKRDINELTTAFGNVMTSTLVMAESPEIESALQKGEDIELYLNSLGLKNVSGVSHLLPSNKVQHQNKIRWDALFNDNEIQSLKLHLDQAAREVGFKAGTFDLFISGLSVENKYIDLNAYNNTIIESILSRMVKVNPQSTRILTTTSLGDANNFKTLLNELKKNFPNAVIYNGKYFVQQTIGLILSELEKVGTIALIFVIIFLVLSTRSIKRTFVLLLPLLISILWTFGILGWLGVKINIINSIVSVFIFGLVVDYCIFLASGMDIGDSKNIRQSLQSTGGAIVISSATTIIGIGVLVFAKHPALFSLGLTASIGIFSGFVCTVLVIPLFLKNPFSEI